MSEENCCKGCPHGIENFHLCAAWQKGKCSRPKEPSPSIETDILGKMIISAEVMRQQQLQLIVKAREFGVNVSQLHDSFFLSGEPENLARVVEFMEKNPITRETVMTQQLIEELKSLNKKDKFRKMYGGY